jgi:ribonuclease D
MHNYQEKVCLLQFSTPDTTVLIDPLAGVDLGSLRLVMANQEIRKIFHAADYDIRSLARDFDITISGLFDTMISSQFLGEERFGLADVLRKYFGVELDKQYQRADWSKRPLSSKQMSYAASDVLYLVALTEQLSRELDQVKRMSWAQEEFEALTRREWSERSFDTMGYLRIKGARKLDPESMSVLSHLYLMRDKRARAIDRPPFKVLGNRALLEIAESQPRTLEALADILAEGDENLRRTVAEFIRNKRIDVAEAGTIQDVYNYLGKDEFDLIFIDAKLPECELLDFFGDLNQRSEKPLVIPFVNGEPDTFVLDCIKAGAFDYLAKPFSREQIEIALHKAGNFNHIAKANAAMAESAVDDADREILGESSLIEETRSMINSASFSL